MKKKKKIKVKGGKERTASAHKNWKMQLTFVAHAPHGIQYRCLPVVSNILDSFYFCILLSFQSIKMI